MTLRNTFIRLLVLMCAAGPLFAHAPELLPPGKRAYLLHLHKMPSFPVKLGQRIDVVVAWGPAGHRVTELVLHSILVVLVPSNKDNDFYLDLAVDQTEAEKLNRAENMPQAKMSIRALEAEK